MTAVSCYDKKKRCRSTAFFTLISGDGVQQFVSLGLLVGNPIGMDGTDLGGLVQTAAKLLAEFGSGIFFAGGHSSAELLLDGFEFADAGTVAEVRLFAGAQTFQSRFGVSHFLLPSYKDKTILFCFYTLRVIEYTTVFAKGKSNSQKKQRYRIKFLRKNKDLPFSGNNFIATA
jgi:hypothetical protein